MTDFSLRLEKAKELILSSDFLTKNIQGGDLPYFIFDYAPINEMAARSLFEFLVREYGFVGSTPRITGVDIFDLMIEILEAEQIKGKTILEMLIDIECSSGKDRFEKALKSYLSPERFVRKIKEKAEGFDIVLIAGIGKAYPFMRSHLLLNNLHAVLDNTPVVMFYPGGYDQKELVLFGLLKDDNYYRAFRLVDG